MADSKPLSVSRGKNSGYRPSNSRGLTNHDAGHISGINRTIWPSGNKSGELCGIVKTRLKKARANTQVYDDDTNAYDTLWEWDQWQAKVKMDPGGKVCGGDSGGIVYALRNGDALVAGIVSQANAGTKLKDGPDEDKRWQTDGLVDYHFGQEKVNEWGVETRCGNLMWFTSFPKYFQAKKFDELKTAVT